eukprot:8348-Chlamydomonas_euryale.AAC.1
MMHFGHSGYFTWPLHHALYHGHSGYFTWPLHHALYHGHPGYSTWPLHHALYHAASQRWHQTVLSLQIDVEGHEDLEEP